MLCVLCSIGQPTKNMHQLSQISIRKLLFRHPLNRLPKPTSISTLNSLTNTSTRRFANSAPLPKPRISDILTCINQSFLHPNISISPTQFVSLPNTREYSSEPGGDSIAEFDENKEVDMINLKFAEAREEIEMAMESKETVYFDEEAECARAAVKEVLDMFEGLLAKLPESNKAALQRSMGLKIEQLKAELQQLND
nr:embryogenesis-like protein [Ziziphus jujuba var. spinosa]